MLVLLCLILRPVAIEFRSQRPSPGWRSFWDYVFFLVSLFLALLFGVAFGDILQGFSLNAEGNISITLAQLLSPYALLVGVTTICMFAMHGALYLTMKTEGALNQRVRRLAPRLMLAFFLLNTLVVLITVLLRLQMTKRYLSEFWPIIFPALALAALIVSWRMLRQGRNFWAFVASGAVIVLLYTAGVYYIFQGKVKLEPDSY
jgi:cytochrome d ubiquinol oxidase subunit II